MTLEYKDKKDLEKLVIETVAELEPSDSGFEETVDEYMKNFIFWIRMYRAMFALGLEHLKSLGSFDFKELEDAGDMAKAEKLYENNRMYILDKEEMIMTVASLVVRYDGLHLYKELMRDAWDEAQVIYFKQCTMQLAAKREFFFKVSMKVYFENVIWELAIRNKENFIDYMCVDARKFFLTDEEMVQVRADVSLCMQI